MTICPAAIGMRVASFLHYHDCCLNRRGGPCARPTRAAQKASAPTSQKHEMVLIVMTYVRAGEPPPLVS